MTTDDKTNTKNQDGFSEFEKLLEKFDYNFKKGNIVKGKVVGYRSNDVLIDIGAKTTARVPVRELSNGSLKTPQEILPQDDQEKEFLIIREEDEDGQLTLSYKKVMLAYSWKELERLKEEDAVVEAEVTAEVKGGILVDVLGIRGFVPSSHIRTKDVEELIGQKIQLKILSVDSKQNNLIMSHRKVVSEQQAEQRKSLFDIVKEGSIVEGEIVRLADFGAFVDIGGIDGLLPLSQISWRWVDHPADILSVGEKIKVQVIGIDEEKQRVSLSLKSLQPDPWDEAAKVIKEGEVIKGNVIRIKHFGAFVEVYPGVEALLPFKDLLEYQNKTNTTVQVGQEIETVILKFNIEDRRISLTTPVSYTPESFETEEKQENTFVKDEESFE
ncbi:MAG TPA: S1 RNA-binding domain-containing protein [Candidatus Gastranaerophilales bacterium]|nr:S1 RNA-binding domain-containing protein [Candidatus Gastranaerophilales bacterium]